MMEVVHSSDMWVNTFQKMALFMAAFINIENQLFYLTILASKIPI
jgi:hypothetical protein